MADFSEPKFFPSGDLKRGGLMVPPKLNSNPNTNFLLDIFQILEWVQKPEDFKENLHFLTDRIQRGFASAQIQISERDEELHRLRLENGGLLRQKHKLESQVMTQQQEIMNLKIQLDREKWGDGGQDVGVNVTKMREAVKQLHATFGAMVDSLRKTNVSIGSVRQEPLPMPHDVQELQMEVDQLFTQVKGKLKRWEKNQREMQVELGQTREVLGRFMEQLMSARETVSKVKAQAKVVNSQTHPYHHQDPVATASAVKIPSPHQIHRSMIHSNGVIQSVRHPSPRQHHQVSLPLTAMPKSNLQRPVPVQMAIPKHRGNLKLPSPVAEKRPRSTPLPILPTPDHSPVPPQHPPVFVNTLASISPQVISLQTPSYACAKCPDVFATLVQLRLHSKVIHKDQLSSPVPAVLSSSSPEDSDLDNNSSPHLNNPKKMKMSPEPVETGSLTLTYHQAPPPSSVIIPSSYPYRIL